MLRATLMTLNDALQTGNFTVLRDVGSPSFRENNTAMQLGQVFAGLAKEVDLTPVAVLIPQLSQAPSIDAQKGLLRIKGIYPGDPWQIAFDLLYEPINGRWRLFGLSVQAIAANPATAAIAPR